MSLRISPKLRLAGLVALLLVGGGCEKPSGGPLNVSAIGGQPRLVNPNLEAVDPAIAYLLQESAQGLVRFGPTGEIEPGLADRWILSDDGLRYTFRLGDANWSDGTSVTAEQVVARLRAARSSASRNALKPLLGAIDEIEAMTEDVIEITLKTPRPNFLQLLAQPHMAIVRAGRIGTGPYSAARQPGGAVMLTLPPPDEETGGSPPRPVFLRGERAALAVARFRQGEADLVVGGTAGDLPVARASRPRADALRFDPAPGMFGLIFLNAEGPLGSADFRRALSMAVDREAILGAIDAPGLQSRAALMPPGVTEVPNPAQPAWAATALNQRRSQAAAIVADAAQGDDLPTLRIGMPEGPGYNLLFAHLRRDWRAIGVDATRVGMRQPADLRLIDAVAPADLASWYLRFFTCDAAAVCDPQADEFLAGARSAPTMAERRTLLASADAIYAELTPFLPLANPVRWHLVAERVTGFAPNPFAIHPAGPLLAPNR